MELGKGKKYIKTVHGEISEKPKIVFFFYAETNEKSMQMIITEDFQLSLYEKE